jgi:glycosyltransferase involved in cell wall biosynthesis
MRVCLVSDMVEERWPSMDLVAEMLLEFLPRADPSIQVEIFRRPLARKLSSARGTSPLSTLDRLLGRHVDYPRALARHPSADVYHIVDHTYAASVTVLPAGRVVVTCHDLDSFTPLLNRGVGPSQRLLRWFARRTLAGLRAASTVVCVSDVVRDQILALGWLDAKQLTVIPNGVHPSCRPDPEPNSDAEGERLLGPSKGAEILHVGSTIPRKRIDTLLQSFAEVRRSRPDARLLRVGGAFTRHQLALLERLQLRDATVVIPYLERDALAAVYRRASFTVLPSQQEGFGLPLIESLACGTPVLASDIPVLREVGGTAVEYIPVGDASAWSRSMLGAIDEKATDPSEWNDRIKRGLVRAAEYSWPEHARRLALLYRDLLSRLS